MFLWLVVCLCWPIHLLNRTMTKTKTHSLCSDYVLYLLTPVPQRRVLSIFEMCVLKIWLHNSDHLVTDLCSQEVFRPLSSFSVFIAKRQRFLTLLWFFPWLFLFSSICLCLHREETNNAVFHTYFQGFTLKRLSILESRNTCSLQYTAEMLFLFPCQGQGEFQVFCSRKWSDYICTAACLHYSGVNKEVLSIKALFG